MIRSSVRSAGLVLLLTMNGCGALVSSSGTSTKTPGLNVAEAALEGGAGQIALAVSEGVLRGSPHDVHAMEIRGDALSLLGDYDGATSVFETLLKRDPDSIRANIGLGRIRLAKDPAAAETFFLAVLKRDAKNLTALNNLGIARDLQGHHAEAQQAYSQALAANPDLDSAQVNMALSLAMSGQAGKAVQLLRAKANQPDAPVKIRHDYAVALAMAGDRAGAEHVLSENMAPDEVRQVLDGVTGTHTRLASGRSQRDDDGVPPDVVQASDDSRAMTRAAPEGVPPVRRPSAVASALPAPAVTADAAPIQASTPVTAMAIVPVHAAPLASAPPPVVSRPQFSDGDADTLVAQPTNPVAAAAANPRRLALPLTAQEATPAAAPVGAADPIVVAMPRPASPRPAASGGFFSAMAAPVVPADRPALVLVAAVPVSAGAPAPVEAPAPKPVRSDSVAMGAALAFAVPPEPARRHAEPASVSATLPAVMERHVGPSPSVQFAATGSEEAAHAVWHSLAHRFPDSLGQRDHVVIRVERGGKVFWRVRTDGLGSIAEAQSLCARMHAGGQACFVPRS